MVYAANLIKIFYLFAFFRLFLQKLRNNAESFINPFYSCFTFCALVFLVYLIFF
jgi:hypothetical protein